MAVSSLDPIDANLTTLVKDIAAGSPNADPDVLSVLVIRKSGYVQEYWNPKDIPSLNVLPAGTTYSPEFNVTLLSSMYMQTVFYKRAAGTAAVWYIGPGGRIVHF